MGPKKAAGAKKKEGNPEDGGELTPEDKAKMFMLACQSLQVQLGMLKRPSLLSLSNFFAENNNFVS